MGWDDEAQDAEVSAIAPVMGTSAALIAGEIDVQIQTAKRYPRDIVKCRQRMLQYATIDQATAEKCFYSLPRAGKFIEGPSIRLAEIVASQYNNIRAGTRIIEADIKSATPHVVVQGVVMDLETNLGVTLEKRRRVLKKKNADRPDEDDLNLAVGQCSAIAFRDAVYKVVPMAFVKPVYEAAREVAKGNTRELPERRSRALKAFAEWKVSERDVLKVMGKARVEDIDSADLLNLLGMYNAIKDGTSTVEEVFGAREAATSSKPDTGDGPTVKRKYTRKAATDATVNGQTPPTQQQEPPAAPATPAAAPTEPQPDQWEADVLALAADAGYPTSKLVLGAINAEFNSDYINVRAIPNERRAEVLRFFEDQRK